MESPGHQMLKKWVGGQANRSRFVVSFSYDEEFRMVPAQSDGQLLF